MTIPFIDLIQIMVKKKIMIFCDSYLPGYSSGGAAHMIVNTVGQFHDEYDFYIVTRNFDSKSNRIPYTSVNTDHWNEVGNAQVFYFSPGNLNVKHFSNLVREIEPDIFLLNSAFSTPSIVLLRARRKRLTGDVPVVLISCGSLSGPSLSFKRLKKQLFLKYASVARLFDGVIWKVTGAAEMHDVKQAIGDHARVMIAPHPTPKTILSDYENDWKPVKNPNSVKFVYFSRLERKKNILYFLERLRSINEGNIQFTVVGPVEDKSYWHECLPVISQLPENITIEVAGAFERQEDALRKVAESHFFVLPTLNEDFGYVFIESMAAGCPNLMSDRTLWADVEEHKAGWRIPLEDCDAWEKRIRECVDMDNQTFLEMSSSARSYAQNWLDTSEALPATRQVFHAALDGGTRLRNGN